MLIGKKKASSMESTTTAEQIIEHVVLLNVKDEEDPGRMVNSLNSLSLDDPDSDQSDLIYLTSGPILRIRSYSPGDADEDDLKLSLSHMVHARFRSQSAYSALIQEQVRPICDLVLTVDWTAEGLRGPLVPKPGSALRLTLFNLKHEAAQSDDQVITELLEGLRRINHKWQSDSDNHPFHLEQISYGQSHSSSSSSSSSSPEPETEALLQYNLKVAALVVFRDLNELDACEEYEDEMRRLIHSHTIQSSLHSLIHLDYVLPRLTPTPPIL